MIGAAIAVGIVLIGLIYLVNHISHNNCGCFDMGIFLGIVLSVFFVIEVGIVSDILAEQIPTALDVYRGNTELMITSVNGIPTDTVVVFKKK